VSFVAALLPFCNSAAIWALWARARWRAVISGSEVMGSFSIWHWLLVLAVVLVVFGGGGKISGLMGDVAKGIKSFKKGLAENEDETTEEVKAIPAESAKAKDKVKG
jgi:sec-independent protein translocase protein TatA